MRLFRLWINILILFACISSASAYDGLTHGKIAKEAFNVSVLNKGYLNNLGISKDDQFDILSITVTTIDPETGEPINDGKPLGWLRDGSIREDDYTIIPWLFRFQNHFYNPINSSGLDFTALGVRITGYPAPNWGLEDTETYSKQLFSIRDARDYFYKGLTMKEKTEREKNTALTFRTLGQIIHLIQDMASPQHTRNDPHGGFFGADLGPQILGQKSRYEFYVERNYIGFEYSGYPIVTFDNYRSYWETSDSKGMSQFSNRNFVTHGTNFTKLEQGNYVPGFPEPKLDLNHKTEVDIQTTDIWGNPLTGVVTFFGNTITDNYTGTSEPNDRMTTYSLFDYDLKKKGKDPTFTLNNFNFESAANILLKRAVGYSVGLLDYFFRGTIEITPPGQYVYSITDGSETPYTDKYGNHHQQFTHIKAKLKNTTIKEKDQNGKILSYEEMQSGILQAVAKYRIRADYKSDLSGDPPELVEPDFSYSVSASRTLTSEEITSINTQPTEFTFDFTNDPIPAGITDLYLYIVFKGTLGNEKDIAVAVGMKDLAEPAHHVFWNLTDMFSLYHKVKDQYGNDQYAHHLHTSDEIKRDDRYNDLGSLVDLNGNRIFNETDEGEPYIDPYDMNFEIAYMDDPDSVPISSARVTGLPDGRYIRLIVLVEDNNGEELRDYHYLRLAYTDNIEQGEVYITDSYFWEVTNQKNREGIFYYTPIETFRHGIKGEVPEPIRQHFFEGILRCLPGAIDPATGEEFCPYPEEESIPANLTPYPVEIKFP